MPNIRVANKDRVEDDVMEEILQEPEIWKFFEIRRTDQRTGEAGESGEDACLSNTFEKKHEIRTRERED